MARKRKKSKAGKKRRKDESPDEARSAAEEKAAPTEATSDADDDDEPAEASKKTEKSTEKAKKTKKSAMKTKKGAKKAKKSTKTSEKVEKPGDQEPGEKGASKRKASKKGGGTPRMSSEDEVGDDERVDAVIEIEEDLDDPDERDELIAAAAGLSGRTNDEADKAEATTGESEDEGDAGPDADGQDRETSVEEDAESAPAEGADQDRTAEEPEWEAPRIGPDALLALSQLRAEGVATMPEELVLDLGETTSAEDRDRLLAAALAHVEMQDAIYRVPLESGTARRWKAVIASVLFVMALFLVGLPPSFLVPEPSAQLTAGERLRGVRVALLLQAQQIEAHRVRQDRLPRSLAEVPAALPGIRYVRSNERIFQLIGYTPDGEAVVYDSASPDPVFDALAESWIAPRDDS